MRRRSATSHPTCGRSLPATSPPTQHGYVCYLCRCREKMRKFVEKYLEFINKNGNLSVYPNLFIDMSCFSVVLKS